MVPALNVPQGNGAEEDHWKMQALWAIKPQDRIAALLEIQDQKFLSLIFQLEIVEEVRAVAARRLTDANVLVDLLLYMKYERLYVTSLLRRVDNCHRGRLIREARDYMIRKMARKTNEWVRR